MSHRLLVIEDDRALNQMLCLHFEDLGFEVAGVDRCSDALPALTEHQPELILLDQQLPDGLGIELLPRLLETSAAPSVIMMTGQHDLELAIQAIKLGASDFIHKPVKTELLQRTVDEVLHRRELAERAEQVDHDEPQVSAVRGLIGRSDAMLSVSKQIALSAESAATVLISGESGTGKEVVARLIHEHSGRGGPFVAVNCAAIVDTLLESELFGHEKGSFTGAQARKIGRFEEAGDGTLFLDEIGELAMPLQAKLLRALQEREFQRVGGNETVQSNARVIAATHRDLFARAAEGEFREDLAYRLKVIDIRLPALRERPDDIPLLVKGLLERIGQNIDKKPLPVSDAALAKLNRHDWPGNVRELENVLTQALVQARDTVISEELIQFATGSAPPDAISAPASADTGNPLRTLEEVEAEHVQRVLDHAGGHKGRTCEILDISRPALDRKIKKYGLSVEK